MKTATSTPAGPGLARTVAASATDECLVPGEYHVRVLPDGSVTVTWPAPGAFGQRHRDAAICDRDGAVAELVRGLLTALRQGLVR